MLALIVVWSYLMMGLASMFISVDVIGISPKQIKRGNFSIVMFLLSTILLWWLMLPIQWLHIRKYGTWQQAMSKDITSISQQLKDLFKTK